MLCALADGAGGVDARAQSHTPVLLPAGSGPYLRYHSKVFGR